MEANTTPDTKKGQGGEEDLSMEEILQSIRRIIADDETGDAVAVKPNGAHNEVHGSDVLELTEMLKDDGSVVSLKDEAPANASADVLSTIDQALGTTAAPFEPEKPAPILVAEPASAPPPPPPPAPVAAAPRAPEGSLLSDQAAAAAAAALRKLKTEEPAAQYGAISSPAFRSGNTVEDMVADMLRPMMKEWLDQNLPSIVERVVEREVRKLSRN